MAVIDLGHAIATGGGVAAVTTPALLNAVSSGVGSNLVVVFTASDSNVTTTLTVTDTKGNTYIKAPTIANSFQVTSIFYSFITTPLTTSDTITYADSAATGFHTFQISACSATGYNAVDAATSNSANTFGSTFSVTGAGAAAVANEIYFGFSGLQSAASGTPSGWSTNPPSTPNSTFFLAGWQINAGTSALTWNGTTTGANNTNSVIASFKPSGVAPVPIVGTKLVFV